MFHYFIHQLVIWFWANECDPTRGPHRTHTGNVNNESNIREAAWINCYPQKHISYDGTNEKSHKACFIPDILEAIILSIKDFGKLLPASFYNLHRQQNADPTALFSLLNHKYTLTHTTTGSIIMC